MTAADQHQRPPRDVHEGFQRLPDGVERMTFKVQTKLGEHHERRAWLAAMGVEGLESHVLLRNLVRKYLKSRS